MAWSNGIALIVPPRRYSNSAELPRRFDAPSIDGAPDKGPVFDAAIIAQCQRMTHFGITNFRTAAAFTKALDLGDDNKLIFVRVNEMLAEFFAAGSHPVLDHLDRITRRRTRTPVAWPSTWQRQHCE